MVGQRPPTHSAAQSLRARLACARCRDAVSHALVTDDDRGSLAGVGNHLA